MSINLRDGSLDYYTGTFSTNKKPYILIVPAFPDSITWQLKQETYLKLALTFFEVHCWIKQHNY